MNIFFYSILGFILAIGVLTAIHEYGHFLAARWLGIRVLRFSIGFGKRLLIWHDKQGTEYAVCAIPLGGYVKMLDQNEGTVAKSDLHLAFNKKPVWVRMLVIAAGPVFNLLFACLAYWAVFMWGISAMVPVLGDVPRDSIAYAAGLHSGQEITAIDGQETRNWEDIIIALISHAGDHDQVYLKVRDINNNRISTHTLNLKNWDVNDGDENILKNLGLLPLDPLKPIIGKLKPDMPAATVGLKPGDLITSVNGEQVSNPSQIIQLLHKNNDQPVQLVVSRDNQLNTFIITPINGMIGIQFLSQPWPSTMVRTDRYLPLPALKMALQRTKEYTVLTVQFLGKMVIGKMSLQHISGPISIAQFAGRTVQNGVESFLGFLALVSISLGVLNMLPIPVLDGGHFLFCIIELIRGKAVSMRVMNVGHAFGFVILGGIMLLAIYNDVLRLFQ